MSQEDLAHIVSCCGKALLLLSFQVRVHNSEVRQTSVLIEQLCRDSDEHDEQLKAAPLLEVANDLCDSVEVMVAKWCVAVV